MVIPITTHCWTNRLRRGKRLNGLRALESTVMDYLKSRWYGTADWIWFHENPQEDLAKISAEIGIDFSKPTIGLLTNVMWDAQLHYPANAFPNMLAWVLQTIDYFASRPDLQLVIRVHPAEIRGTIPSRQKIVDEVAAVYPILPPTCSSSRPKAMSAPMLCAFSAIASSSLARRPASN